MLYPSVKLPEIKIASNENIMPFKYKGPAFDWTSGEFRIDKAGRMRMSSAKETYENWVLKVCMTERGTRLAYSERIGVEMEAVSKINDAEAVKSHIIRTLTEAITVHRQTEYVKNFSFRSDGDNVWIDFTVKGKNFDENRLSFQWS